MKFCKRWKKWQADRKEEGGADLSILGAWDAEPLQEYNSDF